MSKADHTLGALPHCLTNGMDHQGGVSAGQDSGPIRVPPDPPSTITPGSGSSRADPLTLLTVADVARRLQLSERQVRRWIAAGRLPAVYLGRAVRVRPADLAQLMATGLGG